MSIERARDMRRRKAEALASLASGQASIFEVLREPPEALITCSLWDVLLAVPGLGEAKARLLLERRSIWPLTRMGDLGRFDRNLLVSDLRPRP